MNFSIWSKPARYAFVALFTLLACVVLTACGHTEAQGTTDTPALQWMSESAHHHVYLTLVVKEGDKVKEVTLYGDKELDVLDIPDTCVEVEDMRTQEKQTWFAFPKGHHVVLFSPAREGYLPMGEYLISIPFRVRRHISDPSLDVDMTPTVKDVRVSNTIER